MKSKMFLNNVTAIDCAYIDNKGMIIGDSINPLFVVSGEIDEAEKVVVDFSTIKKDIKGVIDAKYSGFDHKLWVIKGYSDCIVEDAGLNYVIVSPLLRISVPKDAVKIITGGEYGEFIGAARTQVEAELIDELRITYPKVNIDIEVSFDDRFWGNLENQTSMVPFRYVHGLKGSTSWGCQNIAHGHLSFISAKTTNFRETEMLLHAIAAEIDGSIFVWDQNVTQLTGDGVTLSYDTDRGHFSMEVDSVYAEGNMIILNTETTVEFLAEAIARQYHDSLLAAGVTELYVSEGLNKGAVVEITGE